MPGLPEALPRADIAAAAASKARAALGAAKFDETLAIAWYRALSMKTSWNTKVRGAPGCREPLIAGGSEFDRVRLVIG
jgi:hypothetical protein